MEHLCPACATESILKVEWREVYRAAGKEPYDHVRTPDGYWAKVKHSHVVLVGVSIGDTLD